MKCPGQEALTSESKREGTVVSKAPVLVHYTFVIVLKYKVTHFKAAELGI